MSPISTDDVPGWAVPEEVLPEGLATPDALYEPAGERRPLRYGYAVGEHRFLTPTDTTCEVLTAPQLFRVPLGPDWLLGVVNRRGNIVPVCDLTRTWGERARRDSVQTALVLGTGDRLVAVAVDALPRALADLERTATDAPLPPPAGEFVRAAFRAEGHSWLELDVTGLLLMLSGRSPQSPSAG